MYIPFKELHASKKRVLKLDETAQVNYINESWFGDSKK